MNSASSWQPDNTPNSDTARSADQCVAGCKPVACGCSGGQRLPQFQSWLAEQLDHLIAEHAAWETNQSRKKYLQHQR